MGCWAVLPSHTALPLAFSSSWLCHLPNLPAWSTLSSQPASCRASPSMEPFPPSLALPSPRCPRVSAQRLQPSAWHPGAWHSACSVSERLRGSDAPHQLPVGRRPVGQQAVHLAPQHDRRERILEQGSREQLHQLGHRLARRPWTERSGQGRGKGTRDAGPGKGISPAPRSPWLPDSPLRGSAFTGPRSRRLFNPKLSGISRRLFRLIS